MNSGKMLAFRRKVQTEEAAKIANDLYEEQLEEEMGWYEKGDNNKKEKKAVKTELKQQKKTPRFTSKDMPSEPLIYIKEDYRVWQKAYNNAIAADEECLQLKKQTPNTWRV